MKERFSAPEIARRKPASLGNLLRRHRVQHPDETAARIILLARDALPPAAHRVATLQRTLTASIHEKRTERTPFPPTCWSPRVDEGWPGGD